MEACARAMHSSRCAASSMSNPIRFDRSSVRKGDLALPRTGHI